MKYVRAVLFLSCSLLIASSSVMAQVATPTYPTLFKCQRTYSKDTKPAGRKRFLSEKFFCEFEYVLIDANFLPLPRTQPQRLTLSIEVPAGRNYAAAMHEISSDYKLIRITPRSKFPSSPVSCQELKGERTESRNDEYVPGYPYETPLKHSRVWAYKGLFSCPK